MFNVNVEGIQQLEEIQIRIQKSMSVEALTERTILIATEAGEVLLKASVRACIEAVYDAPNFPSLSNITPSSLTGDFQGGNEADRTNALLDSHIVRDEGLIQYVEIDESAEAIDPHSGREFVLDYAIPVHEGYSQFVFGNDIGEFHPGRFWFDVALAEAGPVIASFVMQAFEEMMLEILKEIFL